jgi:hypothetical protein
VAVDVPLEKQEPDLAADITSDRKGFLLLVRNEVQRFVRHLSCGEMEEALGRIANKVGVGAMALESGYERMWTAEQLSERMEDFHRDHERLCADLRAFHAAHGQFSEEAGAWYFTQRLVDPEGHNDWEARFMIDRDASRQAHHPCLLLLKIESLQ